VADIKFTFEIGVELIQAVGDDATLAHAAWVSTRGVAGGGPVPADKVRGTLKFLMDNRHGTPFEHGSMTVRVHAPVKVWREWHRHRVGWSYNEESGRYKQLDPVFYVPPRERPMIRPDGFKSSRPAFDTATADEYADTVDDLRETYRFAYDRYERMLARGVDRGLARDGLGVGIYSACYCTANPRSVMHFLELRTNDPAARRPSKPLYEIEVAARKLEALFAAQWPLTYELWVANGRRAP
jgi:thymidylate synthase (FAD)